MSVTSPTRSIQTGGSDSPIRPQVVTEGELAEIDLAAFDCVFLSNVAQLTKDEAARLDRFVRQGGGLAIFLGDQVRAESYNCTGGTRGIVPASRGWGRSRPNRGLASIRSNIVIRLLLPFADASERDC